MRSTLPGILLAAAGFAFGHDITGTPSPDCPEPTPEQKEAAYRSHVLKVLEGVRYREGILDLPGNFARLDLPEGFRFLDSEDARRVVVDLWGNPPGGATDLLGLVVPAGEHLAASDSWAIVLSYHEIGHVLDEDAGRMDHDDLLARLQESSRLSNRARRIAGFNTMELSGWAVAPCYDAGRKVLHWAKRFEVASGGQATLNYDVRVLGRSGVLALNGISGISRIRDIEAASPAIISMLSFKEGFRYTDFDPTTDPMAGHSLTGLVLGGAAAPEEPVEPGWMEQFSKPFLFGGLGLLLVLQRVFGRRKSAA